PGLNIDPGSGTISGTIKPGTAGSFSVTVSASDGGVIGSTSFTFAVNPLEPGVFAVGAGPGGLPLVDVYRAARGAFKYQFQPFETGFTGGVRVAVARDGSGRDIIAVVAGPGGFLVRTFVAGPSTATLIGQFQPFGTFTGGIYVALGDLNGDGQLEVVTSPDAAPNSDPYFNVWGLTGTRVGPNVYAFEKGFHGGVRVAIG